MKKVKMIWCMGTAGLGPGNASPVAEFNVYADADAYKILLDSGFPITKEGYTYGAVENDFKYNVRPVTDVKNSECFERFVEAIRY